MIKDDIQVTNFLKSKGSGTFESFYNIISTRIAAESGWFFIQDSHSVSSFLLETQSISDFHNNCTLLPFYNWNKKSIFYSNYNIGRAIFYTLINSSCDTDIVRSIINNYSISFFITAKNILSVEVYGVHYDSIFIETLPLYTNTVFETEYYQVWDLSILI